MAAPLEGLIYRLGGVNPAKGQSWRCYALAMLWFSLAGVAALYVLQRLQNVLPLNPQHFDAVPPDLALNTAISFTTNTSWQSYAGETTISYLVQMAGITVQSFLSAATGIAVAMALIRGFARRSCGLLAISGWILHGSLSTYCCRFQRSSVCFLFGKACRRRLVHLST
jgi:potassium-transporting ATPase potassium-binding subunit